MNKRKTKIIDNKRISLTDDEYKLYNEITEHYTSDLFDGKDMFKDRFETDENGFISFLIPPQHPPSSMEVWMFLLGVMTHQHLDNALDIVRQKSDLLDTKIKEVDKLIKQYQEIIK